MLPFSVTIKCLNVKCNDTALWSLLTRCAHNCILQYVDEQNGYLCGYLKIKGLTEEFPNLTTYFDGEIINKKCPFLTRKWDADEEVDKKHWVCTINLIKLQSNSN